MARERKWALFGVLTPKRQKIAEVYFSRNAQVLSSQLWRHSLTLRTLSCSIVRAPFYKEEKHECDRVRDRRCEGGCWPQKKKLVYLMYWCNFLSYCLRGRKKIHFSQIHSDGLKSKFIQLIKSCCYVGKTNTLFYYIIFFQHRVMEILIAYSKRVKLLF